MEHACLLNQRMRTDRVPHGSATTTEAVRRAIDMAKIASERFSKRKAVIVAFH